MVIIFILLGLGFLGGGVALIVEGWPYMVLERGFTQVIAGTVLASAGVILLALARVLSELKRVRSTLSNAVMAASLASMATREEPALTEAFALEPTPRRDPAGNASSMPAAAALGGAAAGVLAGAALARTNAGDNEAATPESAGEADLFGVVAPAAIEPAVESAAAEPVSRPADDGEELPFDDAGWLDRELAKGLAPRSSDGEGASPRSDDVPTAEPPSREDDPFASAGEPPASLPADDRDDRISSGGGESEFDFLRESLAHLRAGPDETLSRPSTEIDMRDAAAWMSPRRDEPAAETASGDEPHRRPDDHDPLPALAELDPPAWPPVTQPVVDEPGPAVADTIAEDRAIQIEPQPSEPAAIDAPPPHDDATGEGDDATAARTEPPAPAASDEGVIGAYQVGDAHFTLYADGSIQARTPDGDYRFNSMEELKVYLASEKSRLGL